jgi:hypothetical protein
MPPKKRTFKNTSRAPGKRTRVKRTPRNSHPETAPLPPRDLEVFELHRQFIEVMENDRLLTVSAETRGHYLTVMRSLVTKLAIPGKPLSEIISEIMTEAAPLIFRVMQQ